MARKNPRAPRKRRKVAWKWRKADYRLSGETTGQGRERRKAAAKRRKAARKAAETRERNKRKRRKAALKGAKTRLKRKRRRSTTRRRALSAAQKASRTRARNERKRKLQAKRRKAQASILPVGWQNPMGVPWWVWVGGAVAAYFLFIRKPAAALIPGITAPPVALPAGPIPSGVPQVVDPEDPPVSGMVGNYGYF